MKITISIPDAKCLLALLEGCPEAWLDVIEALQDALDEVYVPKEED